MTRDADQFRNRLDQWLVDSGKVASRSRARALIMAGKVRVADQPCDKPGTRVRPDDRIVIHEADHPYVSRGGIKLEHALKAFDMDVRGRVCLDIGASTGGFTDCLLQHGATCVYAVDVGYGQLAWTLRTDPRVTVIERTNIRHIPFERIGRTVDLIVADVSFISLKTVLVAAEPFMGPGTRGIGLIKPQFEAGRAHVGKGGIVRDARIREEVAADIRDFFTSRGYTSEGVIPSPVPGAKGNMEYLISLVFNRE